MSNELLEQTLTGLLEWVGPLLLEPSEVRRIPSRVPGVYMLHVFAPRLGGYPPFYIGQASDLRRRLLEHLSDRSAKASVRAARELDRAYWSAAPVLDPEMRARIEAGLIAALRPVCNVQLPGAKPVLVNLPPLSFRSVIV